MRAPDPPRDAASAAEAIAAALDARGCEFALGGAIALGYWGDPRGTVDVDLTIFVPKDKPQECVRILQEAGFDAPAEPAIRSLEENGFCPVRWGGLRVDVFLPTIPFYGEARARRRRVRLGNREVPVWSAEVLAVFKMMFFRLKDVADVDRILRVQGERFDRTWVRERLVEIYGERDPRVARWDELAAAK